MSFAPRFSPDGENLIMSLAENGSTNIYIMNLETRKLINLLKEDLLTHRLLFRQMVQT